MNLILEFEPIMEKVLRTNELIQEIFGHLHVLGDEGGVEEFYDGAGTLYNAALSCKRFKTHALDTLWYSSYDLTYLMRLIPNFKVSQFLLMVCWHQRSHLTISQGISYLTGPLNKSDLSTFDRYARRIKEYYEYDSEISTRYRVPVILQLLQCLNRHHLLPNLRHLYIYCLDREQESSHFNSFLMCPSLRYLSMAFDHHRHIESSFPHIVQLAPYLRRLEIMNVSVPEYLLPLISRFRSLQELSATNDFTVSSETFSSTFPFADQLKMWRLNSIVINPGDLSRSRSLGSTGHQFSALQELKLEAPKSIGALSEVFAHNLFPRLKTLFINVKVEFTDARNGGWAKLFLALFSTKNCLQHITIRQWHDSAEYRFPPGDIDIFAPLANAEPQDLKELIVQLPVKKSLPTSSIRTLVGVFPHLTRLEIPKTQILFADLVLLAQGLPHLLDLSIGVDGRALPIYNDIDASRLLPYGLKKHTVVLLDDRNAPPLLSHGLKTIFLENSDIGHPVVFARWLDRLFPVVRVIGVDVSQKVPEVAGILAMMRPLREDQEARILQRVD